MRFAALERAIVAVWGLGRETRGFLAQAEARLPRMEVALVVDEAEDAPEGTIGAEGAIDAILAAQCDVVVRSPGVSVHRPGFDRLKAARVVTITPTGLWMSQRAGQRVIGVTGSKGKTTTATFIHHLIRAAGEAVHLAGNIGMPALDLLDVPTSEWVVCELSSYQIADLRTGPECAVATNLYREHTDWHGSEEQYRADKLRLFELRSTRVGVVPAGVPELVAAAEHTARPVRFGDPEGWHVRPDGIACGDELRIPSSDLHLRGEHNLVNLCGALATVDAIGLLPKYLSAAVMDLPMPPHRLQTVHRDGAVEWVDDSISTVPESAMAAVRSVPDDEGVVLIGGGVDRGQEHAELGAVLAEAGAAVIGLPDTGERLVAAAVEAGVPAERTALVPDMAAAVAAARRLARAPAVILLSPAAPSYNAYANFEARGDDFAALAAAR